MELTIDPERTDGLEDKQEAVTALYHAYTPRCYRAALAVLREPPLAEEAVQEAWLKVVRLARNTPMEDVERQLFTILKNTALDLLRKEKRYAPLPEGWDLPGGDGALEGAEFRRLVALIRILPEGYRTVLELKCLGECSNREIAKRLKMPESTVATKVQRGRALLLDAMKKEGYFDDGTEL